MTLKHPCILLLLLVFLAACSRQEAETPGDETAGSGYFSIRQFAADQFDTHRGMPFVIEKQVVLNGRKDSATINSYNADWEPLLTSFFSADISSGKFADQYDVSLFDDGAGARVLYYTAKQDKLFTRVLQVRVDAATNRILSLYAETATSSFWNKTSRKLYYAPMKLIQIQEFSKPLIGKKRELRIEYRFML